MMKSMSARRALNRCEYSQEWDRIWLEFDPQAEHEQAGRRPAIILSEQDFNEVTGFAVVCRGSTEEESEFMK